MNIYQDKINIASQYTLTILTTGTLYFI